MEELPKNLISFFLSFIKSHTDSLADKEKLIRRMMSMKNVQSIIIETMFKLEPIINDQVISIKNQTPFKSLNSKSRESHLLTLSRDIKQQMENFANIQESLSNVLNLVDNINLNVEMLPAEPLKSYEEPELVTFLSTMAGKPQIADFEIDDIASDTWAKHMEVEKMLKVEVQKYENHLQRVENSYFIRISALKQKTADKIIRLENELQKTWEHFRELVDRSSMSFEDKLSKESEQYEKEEKILAAGNEMQAKDYSQAMAKIKNLFSARKILEKRKHQDEKFIEGLNSKIALLTEKLVEMKNLNENLIENCGSLSWCLEFLVTKMDIPVPVKEKVLKLISKQKCKKIEDLFKVEEVFEKYSVESLSKKFENLKDGIAEVCIHVADENLKIKLRKLISDSKLEELDKKSTMKNLQPPKAPISFAKRGKSSAGNIQKVKKDLIKTPKETKSSVQFPKPESSLDKMKKALLDIDKQIAERDKSVEEVYMETLKVRDSTIQELSVNDTIMKSIENEFLSPKALEKIIFSPDSMRSGILDIVSTRSDITFKETKSTQTLSIVARTCTSTPNHDQVNLHLLTIQNFPHIFVSPLVQSKIKIDKFIQTEKENFSVDMISQPTSLLHGLIAKTKILKSDNSLQPILSLAPNISESMIVTKLSKSKHERTLRDNIIGHIEESLENISKQKKKLDLTLNNSIPISEAEKSSKTFQKVTPSKLALPLTSRKQNNLNSASEQYRKEFKLQAQAKGIKKMDSHTIQMVMDEVISRRLLEGEKDKISVHLRGYLGTDRFESEKSKMISIIESKDKHEEQEKIYIKLEKNKRSFENWKKLMTKFLERLSFNFRSLVSENDSTSDILFKVAKNLKFVKHRLMRKANKTMVNSRKEEIIFAPDKWAVNFTSLSPLESLKHAKKLKLLKKPKFLNRFVSKTPIKEKLLGLDTNRLPYL